jgi:general secretion pathway protein M
MAVVRTDALRDRVAAVGLLLLVLLLIYVLGVHWWFTAPFLQARSDLIELRDQELQLRSVAQLREQVEQRLAEVRSFEANNPEFLPEENFDLAASAIIQRLQALVDEQNAGQSCSMVSLTPFRSSVEEPFQRVTIKVRMRCTLQYLAPVLHGLETGSPRLFVNEFAVMNRSQMIVRPGQVSGVIDANFDVYGFLRKPNAEATR